MDPDRFESTIIAHGSLKMSFPEHAGIYFNVRENIKQD